MGGSLPVIVCPARSLRKLRIPKEWKKSLDEGHLLFFSPFADNRHRGDVEMAFYRNRFVAALADKIFVAYAAPKSKTKQFCREMLGWEKELYTLESDMTQALMALGAQPLTASQASSELV